MENDENKHEVNPKWVNAEGRLTEFGWEIVGVGPAYVGWFMDDPWQAPLDGPAWAAALTAPCPGSAADELRRTSEASESGTKPAKL